MAARESLLNRAQRLKDNKQYGDSSTTAFAVDLLTALAEADGLTEHQKYNLAGLVDAYVFHRPTRDFYWAKVKERKERFSKK